jgi:hypothetical protein
MRNCKCGCGDRQFWDAVAVLWGYKASRRGKGERWIYFFAVGGDLTLFDSQAW